jgi:Putative 2OG-Fe(II) oxygenase
LLKGIATSAVLFVENNDFLVTFPGNPLGRERALKLAVDQQEAWVNLNTHGNYNTLHTHTGSTWSGIYYIKSPTVHSTSYSGKLILKPTPHITESVSCLDKIDLGRLRLVDLPRDGTAPTHSCCDWLCIEPEEGAIIIIPSYLQHAVLPLSIQKSFQDKNEGRRISFAFNIVLE